MNFKEETKKLVNTISNFKNILIVIKGSPDPDAIASAFALKVICEYYKIRATILAYKHVSLKQNRMLINKLNIPIVYWNSKFKYSDYDSYAIVDFQNAKIENIPTSIPCVLHIDHHEIIKQENVVEYSIVEPKNVSSTSTIFIFILKELSLNLDKSLLKRLSTALIYGMITDTDNLIYCNDCDREAFKFIAEYKDTEVLNKILKLGFSKSFTNVIKKANESKIIYKNCLITGIGYIKQDNRDIIALISDALILESNFDLVIVYAIIEDVSKSFYLDASLRTKNRNFDLNGFIKNISKDGGGRRYKGAYQVDLAYFNLNSKEEFWKYINDTTVNRLQKQIDNKVKFSKTKKLFNSLKSFFQGNK